MQFSNVLTDFSGPKTLPDEVSTAQNEALEDEKLKSFEDGYSAGWDDAMKAQEERGRKLSSALQEAVAQARVTKEEAFGVFSEASANLLNTLLGAALPKFSSQIVSFHAKELIERFSIDLNAIDTELVVSSHQVDVFTSHIKDIQINDLKIIGSSDLDVDQAVMRFSGQEKGIDLDELYKLLHTLCETIVTRDKEDGINV